jgi:hypothetical protein
MANDSDKNKGNSLKDQDQKHPSIDLGRRSQGFGIGGGYERPYAKNKGQGKPSATILRYGPIPHSGYYGSTDEGLRFKVGQAGFKSELDLYKAQYGDKTSNRKS